MGLADGLGRDDRPRYDWDDCVRDWDRALTERAPSAPCGRRHLHGAYGQHTDLDEVVCGAGFGRDRSERPDLVNGVRELHKGSAGLLEVDRQHPAYRMFEPGSMHAPLRFGVKRVGPHDARDGKKDDPPWGEKGSWKPGRRSASMKVLPTRCRRGHEQTHGDVDEDAMGLGRRRFQAVDNWRSHILKDDAPEGEVLSKAGEEERMRIYSGGAGLKSWEQTWVQQKKLIANKNGEVLGHQICEEEVMERGKARPVDVPWIGSTIKDTLFDPHSHSDISAPRRFPAFTPAEVAAEPVFGAPTGFEASNHQRRMLQQHPQNVMWKSNVPLGSNAAPVPNHPLSHNGHGDHAEHAPEHGRSPTPTRRQPRQAVSPGPGGRGGEAAASRRAGTPPPHAAAAVGATLRAAPPPCSLVGPAVVRDSTPPRGKPRMGAEAGGGSASTPVLTPREATAHQAATLLLAAQHRGARTPGGGTPRTAAGHSDGATMSPTAARAAQGRHGAATPPRHGAATPPRHGAVTPPRHGAVTPPRAAGPEAARTPPPYGVTPPRPAPAAPEARAHGGGGSRPRTPRSAPGAQHHHEGAALRAVTPRGSEAHRRGASPAPNQVAHHSVQDVKEVVALHRDKNAMPPAGRPSAFQRLAAQQQAHH